MKTISSTQNSQIKLIRSLSNKKARLNNRLFVVEGGNIVKDMPISYAREFFIKESELDKFLEIAESKGGEITVVKDSIFDSICDTITPSGILALCDIPNAEAISGNVVMVLDGVTDSGNIGTIIRTATAMGVKDVVCVESADVFSPKVVRSTMGGIFHVNVINCTRAEVKELLYGYDVLTLDMMGENVYEHRISNKSAIVVGNEAHGISDEIASIATKVLSIPMPGRNMESLNAGVSASIALSALINNKNI